MSAANFLKLNTERLLVDLSCTLCILKMDWYQIMIEIPSRFVLLFILSIFFPSMAFSNLFSDQVGSSGGLSGSFGSWTSVWILHRSFDRTTFWIHAITRVPASCVMWHGQAAPVNRRVSDGTSADVEQRWSGPITGSVLIHHWKPIRLHLWGHADEGKVSFATPQPVPVVWHHAYASTCQQWVQSLKFNLLF